MHPDIKSRLLIAGVLLAERHGFQNVTRFQIAAHLEVSPGCVSYHWKDMEKLRSAIVREAITAENATILSQALSAQHPLTRDLPQDLRRRVLRKLVG